MVSKLSDLILDLITLTGIGIAIVGSLGLLKYEKKPREEDVNNWIKRYEKKHGKWDPQLKDLVRGELDVGSVWDADDHEAPKKFIKSWKTRRKISRFLIIMGPGIAAAPIALSIAGV